MSVVTVTRPLGDIHQPIDTIEALREHLQWAFLVEFSTIPPYLTALYSIQDKTTDVYSLIRSVALEEMVHLNLVSNLLNGTGTTPQLVGHVPEYPTYLTHHAAGGPYIQLMPASVTLMTQTFMAIELPSPFQAPAEGDRYQTIGQFYKAIDEGFERCVARFGAGAVFQDTGFQRVDYDFANSGGHAIYVHDLASARLAISEIVQQGEGAETPQEPYHPDEPWGGYEHYGMRPDGTYGPILGTPLELSHYFKFKAVADGVVPLPAVYPMAPNPDVDRFENPIARQVAEIFNGCYGVLVRAVELAFSSDKATDPFFTVVVPIMQAPLPLLATELMQLPVLTLGDPILGPTAGPPFRYEDTPLVQVADKVTALLSSIQEPSHASTSLTTLATVLRVVQQTLTDIHIQARAGDLPIWPDNETRERRDGRYL